MSVPNLLSRPHPLPILLLIITMFGSGHALCETEARNVEARIATDVRALKNLQVPELPHDRLTFDLTELVEGKIRAGWTRGYSVASGLIAPSWLGRLLRICTALIGTLLLYSGIFLYEDEENHLQNKLEALWINVDDYQKLALRKQVAVLNLLAAVILSRLNRSFGNQPRINRRGVLRSFRFGVISLVSGFGIYWFFELLCSMQTSPCRMLQASFGTIILAIALGVGPMFLGERAVKWLSIVSTALVVISAAGMILVSATVARRPGEDPLFGTVLLGIGIALILALPLSGLSTALLITASRRILESIRSQENLLPACQSLLLLSTIGILLLASTAAMGYIIAENPSVTASLLTWLILSTSEYVLLSNLFAASLSLSALSLLVIMVAHRLIWPIVSRPIHSVSRFGVFRHRKTIAAVGVSMIGVQFPAISELLRKIIGQL